MDYGTDRLDETVLALLHLDAWEEGEWGSQGVEGRAVGGNRPAPRERPDRRPEVQGQVRGTHPGGQEGRRGDVPASIRAVSSRTEFFRPREHSTSRHGLELGLRRRWSKMG